jgi:glycosyltransferase involved in cell wall biosynthesis
LSEAVGLFLLIRYRVGPGPEDGRLLGLVYACRRIGHPGLRAWLTRELRPWLTPERAPALRAGRIGAAIRQQDVSKTALYKSLLIKEPGPDGEKGVLYIAGEDNLARLLVHHDARRFLAEYLVVGASTWSPTDYAVLAAFAGLSDDPLFVGISNPADVEAYRVLHPTVAPLPVMAGDWINPDYYSPRPPERREIDILMVANFSPWKRHWLLFQALRKMRADLRVALIGIRTPTRGEAELRAEARAFGVRQELEILTNASIDTVTAYMCNARISAILTQREGSCQAVTESFFADTPVALMHGCAIGSRGSSATTSGRTRSPSWAPCSARAIP